MVVTCTQISVLSHFRVPITVSFTTMLKSPECKVQKLSVSSGNFGTLGVRAFVDLFKGGWTSADKNAFTLDLDFHAGCRWMGLYLHDL